MAAATKDQSQFEKNVGAMIANPVGFVAGDVQGRQAQLESDPTLARH
ncbi:MAG: hypothetical protein ACI8Y4_001010 [Candidatus Poriferisodalaceae bacterium]|jgi:hypothetical protein